MNSRRVCIGFEKTENSQCLSNIHEQFKQSFLNQSLLVSPVLINLSVLPVFNLTKSTDQRLVPILSNRLKSLLLQPYYTIVRSSATACENSGLISINTSTSVGYMYYVACAWSWKLLRALAYCTVFEPG